MVRDEVAGVRRSRSQSVTLKRGAHIKYAPLAFTEHVDPESASEPPTPKVRGSRRGKAYRTRVVCVTAGRLARSMARTILRTVPTVGFARPFSSRDRVSTRIRA